jgi:ATP-dependent Clp protease ATP-binding subunit ClpB
MEELKQTFKPEFLNRLDEVVIFDPLSPAQISKIVDLQLEEVQKRLVPQGITLQVTAAAKQMLAQRGYDAHYGARPLKRVIEKQILNELARLLVSGHMQEGQAVKIDEKGGELIIKKGARRSHK